MSSRMRRTLMAGVVGVLLLVGAGYALADTPLADTQSPLQAVETGQPTVETAVSSLLDALNGDNRPEGANGLESEFPSVDPRYVEGPAGGLLKNGPFE